MTSLKKLNSQSVIDCLASITLEDSQIPLKNSKCLKVEVEVHDENIDISLVFHYPNQSQHEKIARLINEKLRSISDQAPNLSIQSKIRHHQVQTGAKGLPNIKNIIAVGSGKGGVGKSTVSVNLARALAAEGASVGILDSDIYGPSIPIMLNISERPTSPDGKTMNPLISDGIKTMSIGFLTEPDTPMIWRGPIATNTLKQLLSETNWGDLDYLIVDLPPGTGDIQLTLAQNIPVSGAIIVSTPQSVALSDARKALRMFEKVNIHTLGIVENMSDFVCTHCGKTSAIFKSHGGEKLSNDFMTNFLGKIPLNQRICEAMDSGSSLQNSEEEGLFDYYLAIAHKMCVVLAQRPIDFTAVMPQVEIKNITKN